METQDCYQGLLAEVPEAHRDADRSDLPELPDRPAGTPVTGPIYVEDAHIGDVLSIQVKEIKTAATGVFAVQPDTGVPGQDLHKQDVRVLEVGENSVKLDDRLALPLRPVIGNLGVAAKHGEIDTLYPGRHGGNMDTLEITTGSRVYLPVQVNGALLSLGDVKACVGDGQIAGSGVEVEAEVTLRVDTLPGGRFSWPRVESKGEWITITSASTVEQAARLAIAEMVKWISQDKGLDFETAYALVSLGGSLRVSQWGNPLTTTRMVFPKRLINKLKSVPAVAGRINYRSLPPAANGDADGETMAAEAEKPASRSSRKSGSGRSQRASGRSSKSGSRRGTRQKSNGAPSSASAENGRQEAEAIEQQEAASPQEAAAVEADEKISQPETVAEHVDEKTSRREAATVEATTVEADDKDGQAAAKDDGQEDKDKAKTRRTGRTSRTGRGGRRRVSATKKDSATDQADASATATATAPESNGDSEAPARQAPAASDREDTREPAVAVRKKKSRAKAAPEANEKPEAEAAPEAKAAPDAKAALDAKAAPEAVTEKPKRPAARKEPRNEGSKTESAAAQEDPGQKDAKQEGTARKPAYGRRQRTVRRA